MALLNRISRLFKADFNAVLDQIEEPEIILRQAIRDMEDELAGSEIRIATCIHEQQTLEERENEVASTVTEIDRELDLCFEAGENELAKSLIRRKLQATRTLKQLATRMRSNHRFLEKERGLLEENQVALEALRQKADIFLSEADARSCTPGNDTGALTISRDEIEIAFLREQATRSAP